MESTASSSSMGLSCVLCGRQEDCPEKYGEKKTYHEHGLTLHYNCLLLSSGIWQRGEEDQGIYGFLVDDIKKEINRAKKLNCCICKRRGASIGCVVPKCRRSYHYPCGMEKECIFQFTESFRSYCWDHRPAQNIHSSHVGGSSTCTICLETVEHIPSYHVLQGPCCKSSWYHRNCLQIQALSAGLYFFRCTVCNNKETFQNEMLRMGICIPERDAAWELEENAFHELLERYERCDVEECMCPDGREYNKSDSKWEIVRCQCCGSSGTHVACSSLQGMSQSWECLECQSIVCTPDDAVHNQHTASYLLHYYQRGTSKCVIKALHHFLCSCCQCGTLEGKRSRPASLTPAKALGCLGYGMGQSSPKCPRISTTPQRNVVLRPINRAISDILQDLKLQCRASICSLLVQKGSLWDSSIRAFRKSTFTPYSTLRVKYSEYNLRKANLQHGVSVSEYFGLLLKALENSLLFDGSERKNLSMDPGALTDNLYYEAGRMVALSLVHGGPAPGFLSNTLFYCIIYDPQYVQPVLDDVADPDVLQAIQTIQSCNRIQMLKSAVNTYYDYLQNTGSMRLVNAVSDKVLLVKDMLAYHVVRRVQHPLESFKQGLQTLGVLEKVQAHPTAFWSILCMKPGKLTAKVMTDLFKVVEPPDLQRNPQCGTTSFWVDYLEDTEEGVTSVSLENILLFVTGLDSIPPAGFHPQPSVLFTLNILPKAQRSIHCLTLPILFSYSEFCKILDRAICDSGYPEHS